MTSPRLREAGSADAEPIALLHADSWRRHYRGAYADAFLDGDVVADRLSVWSTRLVTPAHSATILAEDDAGLVGFVHVVLDDDATWGSLVDNLHVTSERRRTGVGRALLVRAAEAVATRASGTAMYLWVLEQNTAAQGFYRTLGGTCSEHSVVSGPASRINGSPGTFRMTWPDARVLASGDASGSPG